MTFFAQTPTAPIPAAAPDASGIPAARIQTRIQTRTDAAAGLPTPRAGQGHASPARGVAGRLGRGVARLAAAAGLLALAACATGSDRAATPDAPSSPSAPAAPSTPVTGPVPVALLLPLGAAEERDAASARAIENGARLALQGAGGSAVRLSVIDTRGTPEGATSAANTAIAGGARLILGPLFGRNASAVAGPAGAAGINVLSLSTDVTVAGPPVWITGFTPSDEVDRILGYAAGRGIQRLGVYAPDIPYGNAALEAARRLAPRHGIALVAAESYPRSFQDIERTAPLFAEAARASGADAVLLPDFGQGLTTASTYVDFVGLPQPGVRYLGIGQWEAPATLREPTLTGGWFAGADVGAVDAIARRYSARYGERPPFLAVLGHDVALIAATLAEEARRSRGADPFSAAALTRETGFAGAVGAIRLLPDGTVRRGLAVLEVGQGRFAVLDPAPVRFAAGL